MGSNLVDAPGNLVVFRNFRQVAGRQGRLAGQDVLPAILQVSAQRGQVCALGLGLRLASGLDLIAIAGQRALDKVDRAGVDRVRQVQVRAGPARVDAVSTQLRTWVRLPPPPPPCRQGVSLVGKPGHRWTPPPTHERVPNLPGCAPMPDDILTVREVAALLKVSDKTVRRLEARGELPSFRVGAQLRFRRVDIYAWVEAQRSAGSQPEDAG